MKHYIVDDTYTIVNDDNDVLLSIILTEEPGDQIIMTTGSWVYAGPIRFLDPEDKK